MHFFFSFLFFFLVFATGLRGEHSVNEKAPRIGVTNELGGGRFGDKLIGYLHAKWISYKYNIPLLYQPFKYSNQLYLDKIEIKYTSNENTKYGRIIQPVYGSNINYSDKSISTLYIIPYFPENLWEHTEQNKWYYFKVDWEDPKFKQLIKKYLRPNLVRPIIKLPANRTAVAVHVRKGGGFDTPDTWKSAPLKLPPESYYIDQIGRLINILGEKPLYIHIFTDDPNPIQIVENYKRHFEDKNIQWGCRLKDNNHDSNVIQDFFEMTRFDCLIRPDSNYSIVVSKLTDFNVMISPVHFTWTGENEGYVDEVQIDYNKKFKDTSDKEKDHVID